MQSFPKQICNGLDLEPQHMKAEDILKVFKMNQYQGHNRLLLRDLLPARYYDFNRNKKLALCKL